MSVVCVYACVFSVGVFMCIRAVMCNSDVLLLGCLGLLIFMILSLFFKHMMGCIRRRQGTLLCVTFLEFIYCGEV